MYKFNSLGWKNMDARCDTHTHSYTYTNTHTHTHTWIPSKPYICNAGLFNLFTQAMMHFRPGLRGEPEIICQA